MMSFLDTLGAAAAGVSPLLSAGIRYVSNALKPKGVGGGGGGVFTEDASKPNSSNSSNDSGDGSGGSGGDGSGGSGESEDGSTNSTDNTAENVKMNDPEKNKTLAEIRMSEELRETFSLTIKVPYILEKLHTNQFFWLEVSDDFYDKNYPTIMEIIANKKFGRYAGFEKSRFFVDKVIQKGGVDGFGMEITLNPIAPSHGTYVKMQQDAEKALIEALNDNSKYGGGTGSLGSGNISSATLDEIYNIAATFVYDGAGTGLSPEKAWEHYQNGGRNFDCYDCSNWLFYCLREKGIACRIVQGYSPSSRSGTHRVVQIYENGTWHCPKQAWNLTRNLRPFTPEDKYSLTPRLTYNGTETITGG